MTDELLEKITRLESKLERQQEHHMKAMSDREEESQELWNDLHDEVEELKKENKRLQGGLDNFKKSHCVSCGATGWRLIVGAAPGPDPIFPMQEEIKALKYTINETHDCGHHRDVARWQQTLTKTTEENKELQLEVLSLLGQLQDRTELQNKIDALTDENSIRKETMGSLALLDEVKHSYEFILMRKSRNLWRAVAMAAGDVIPNYNYGEYHDVWNKTIESLREFGEEYPYVDSNPDDNEGSS